MKGRVVWMQLLCVAWDSASLAHIGYVSAAMVLLLQTLALLSAGMRVSGTARSAM